jgi:hypothetical protein
VTDTSGDDEGRAIIVRAGLTPSPDEMALFEMMYPLLRSRADVVHDVELGYEE